VETVTTLLALADKCARAAHGRAWYLASQGGPTQTGALMPLPLVAARRRTRRIAAQTSRRLELRTLQRQRPGARTRAANVRTSSVATLGHALFILEPVTVPPNVAGS
jgi:hypothetical protein